MDEPFGLPCYILKDKMALKASSFIEWSLWMHANDNTVQQTTLDEVLVSTVFLGLDHNWAPNGDPLLFETMVFSHGEALGRMDRYFTWAEAEAGHAEFVQALKEEQARAHCITEETLARLAGARA